MIWIFLLWNVILCNEATKLVTFVSERDGDSQSNPSLLSSVSYNNTAQTPAMTIKKKRNAPGRPDRDSKVIALSPKTLLATNRFSCEVCLKEFTREQNLQIHRRGHNLFWKLKQRNSGDNKKKVYICPEPHCVHNDPSRALSDLSGIKKHFIRKHVEKIWRCEKCAKSYAFQGDLKTHSKKCYTKVDKAGYGSNTFRHNTHINTGTSFASIGQESASITANTLIHNTPSPLPPPPFPRHSTHLNNHSISPLFSYPPPPPHYDPHIFSFKPTSMWDLPTQNPKAMWSPSIQTDKLMCRPFTTNPSSLHNNLNTLSNFYAPPSNLPTSALLQNATSIGSQPSHEGSTMVTSGMSSHFDEKRTLMYENGGNASKGFLGSTSKYGGHANVGLRELPTFLDEHELKNKMGRSRVAYGFAVDHMQVK